MGAGGDVWNTMDDTQASRRLVVEGYRRRTDRALEGTMGLGAIMAGAEQELGSRPKWYVSMCEILVDVCQDQTVDTPTSRISSSEVITASVPCAR